jgi:RimJ/RimL family protein N-acetyltransferase
MYLRKCSLEDCDILYKWANDPTVRRNAFNTSPIPYSDHVDWLNKSLSYNKRIIFICMKGDKSVGQIRIDEEDFVGVISYVVDKSERGRGIGSKMLKMIHEIVSSEYKHISILKGLVKKENMASRKVFLNNGYRELEQNEYMVYTLEVDKGV